MDFLCFVWGTTLSHYYGKRIVNVGFPFHSVFVFGSFCRLLTGAVCLDGFS